MCALVKSRSGEGTSSRIPGPLRVEGASRKGLAGEEKNMLTIRVSHTKTERVPGPFGGEREIKTTVTEDVPLRAPGNWSCFTKTANRRLTRLAEKAMAEVEAAGGSYDECQKALVDFVTRWYRYSYTKAGGLGGCGDTVVREVVGDFHDRLARASGHWTEFDVYDLWEKNYNTALSRVFDERKRKREKGA